VSGIHSGRKERKRDSIYFGNTTCDRNHAFVLGFWIPAEHLFKIIPKKNQLQYGDYQTFKATSLAAA
jgi:hypothetical protein